MLSREVGATLADLAGQGDTSGGVRGDPFVADSRLEDRGEDPVRAANSRRCDSGCLRVWGFWARVDPWRGAGELSEVASGGDPGRVAGSFLGSGSHLSITSLRPPKGFGSRVRT